jgi:hypothetical protein
MSLGTEVFPFVVPPPLLKISSYRVSYSCRSRHRKKTKKERRLKKNQPATGSLRRRRGYLEEGRHRPGLGPLWAVLRRLGEEWRWRRGDGLDDLNLLSWAMQAGPPARLQFAGVWSWVVLS